MTRRAYRAARRRQADREYEQLNPLPQGSRGTGIPGEGDEPVANEERMMGEMTLLNGQVVERRSVSLYPEDWAEVDTMARVRGSGVSGALRMIIREWRDMRDPERAARETRLRALGAAYFTQQITAEELAGEVVRLAGLWPARPDPALQPALLSDDDRNG